MKKIVVQGRGECLQERVAAFFMPGGAFEKSGGEADFPFEIRPQQQAMAAALEDNYDTDHRTDPAVYNTANGNWMLLLSANNYIVITLTGSGGNEYRPGVYDFDGDGKADPTLYETATGTWHIKLSASGYATVSASSGYTP